MDDLHVALTIWLPDRPDEAQIEEARRLIRGAFGRVIALRGNTARLLALYLEVASERLVLPDDLG